MILSLFVTHSIHNFLELFDLYWFYPVYVIVLLFGALKLGLKKLFWNKLSVFILAISIISLLSMFINPYPLFLWVKQVGGWVFFGYSWLAIILMQSYGKTKILTFYTTVAIIAAFLTIPEQILHLNGIHLTPMKGGWLGLFRCYSISDEPFPLALLIVPVIIYYLEKGKTLTMRERVYLIILLIGLFFTFSGAGWLAIGLYFIVSLFIKSSNHIKAIRISIFALFVLAFSFYSGTRLRISETVSIFTHFPKLPNQEVLNQTNTSSRAIYLNAITAWHQFTKNPLIGGGLGSHGVAYENVVTEKLTEKKIFIAHYNQLDGASGAIRWLSEMGIFGFLLFFWFVYRISTNRKKDLRLPALGYWSCFLLHAGNYFQFGSLMWMLLVGFDVADEE